VSLQAAQKIPLLDAQFSPKAVSFLEEIVSHWHHFGHLYSVSRKHARKNFPRPTTEAQELKVGGRGWWGDLTKGVNSNAQQVNGLQSISELLTTKTS